MGKFANAEGLAKKREELAMRLVPQGLNNADLEIGLSLGGFDSQSAAQAELARLSLRGIRTARVGAGTCRRTTNAAQATGFDAGDEASSERSRTSVGGPTVEELRLMAALGRRLI